MSREVNTEIIINVPKEIVWKELTNFEDYPLWNPFAKSIQGTLAVGEKLMVNIDVPNQGKMAFKPLVIDHQENKRFAWRGKLLINGIFDGEHSFEVESISENKCRLIQREVFNGILAAMMWKKLKINTSNGFESMNSALKARCERLV